MREHCPDELLSSFLDGDLSPAEAGQVAEHVATCAACRASLAQVRRLRDAAAALEPMAPPDRTWQAIMERVARRPAPVLPRWIWYGVPALSAATLLVAFFTGRALVARYRVREVARSGTNATPAQVSADARQEYDRYVRGLDAGLQECEAALEENPGNERVRGACATLRSSRDGAMDRLVSGGD